MCYTLKNGQRYCEDIKYTEEFGYMPSTFEAPLNKDGSHVDPSLYDPFTMQPKYEYNFPEQWNSANPLFPLPPYPDRPKPPTQAELNEATAQYGPEAPTILVNSPAYAF